MTVLRIASFSLCLLLLTACDKQSSRPPAEADTPTADEAAADQPVFAEPPPARDEDDASAEPTDDQPVLDAYAGPATGLTWFTTCGDPVCSGYSGPWPDVPACGSNAQGQACAGEGTTCDFESGCNARLVCAREDPKQRPGGCPISRARYKRDIEYLDDGDLADYQRELMELRLATYRYREGDERVRLGVILEDAPDGGAVWADPAHDRVDLYGYASLAIATAQAQARELEQLRAELEALRAELEQLREDQGSPSRAARSASVRPSSATTSARSG
jgi:hypothetical protein